MEYYEKAYDEKSAFFTTFDIGFNLCLKHFDHLLAAVCIIKDPTYKKKELLNINFEILKSAFGKIVKASEKIIHSSEEKKK